MRVGVETHVALTSCAWSTPLATSVSCTTWSRSRWCSRMTATRLAASDSTTAGGSPSHVTKASVRSATSSSVNLAKARWMKASCSAGVTYTLYSSVYAFAMGKVCGKSTFNLFASSSAPTMICLN